MPYREAYVFRMYYLPFVHVIVTDINTVNILHDTDKNEFSMYFVKARYVLQRAI
jgi:hypothetical protein